MRKVKLFEQFLHERTTFEGNTVQDLLDAIGAGNTADVFVDQGEDGTQGHFTVRTSDIDPASDTVFVSDQDGGEKEINVSDIAFIETVMKESLNEGNLDSLKLILQNLKDASDDEINKICNILSPRMTFGLIHHMAQVLEVEDKIKK